MFSKVAGYLACVGATALALAPLPAEAQAAANVVATISIDQPGPVISRDIFGQFAEHLGEGIYGGVWVGEGSSIPNVRGIRSDVVQALRELKVPNVRWPGGCFADLHNWRNGVGPAARRPRTLNANWGNVLEPNTFGTHEFLDFVEQIGSEAFVVVNVGTGSPREASDWLEYMTTDQPSSLGLERQANGRKAPWRIKYLGIGNESWACGGSMSAAAYVQQLKTFTTFVQNSHPDQASPLRYVRGPNAMQRIAVGPEGEGPEYTDAVMEAWKESRPWRWGFEGLALHFYAMGSTPMTSPATGFNEAEYARFLKETLGIETLIAKHAAIMDKHDPEKKVALVVDEWVVWLRPLAGTNPRFLKQQNSLRDGILASLNLNIFARHADRVRMANVAQMINVLQAMILTDGPRMLLTPTYHVFRMYVPFQDAELIPVTMRPAAYRVGDISVPGADAIAARGADGAVWVAVTNVDPARPLALELAVPGVRARRAVGQTLSAAQLDAVNTFGAPGTVLPTAVTFRASGSRITLKVPAKSVTVVRLEE